MGSYQIAGTLAPESCEFEYDYAQKLINDSKFELYRLYHEEKFAPVKKLFVNVQKRIRQTDKNHI